MEKNEIKKALYKEKPTAKIEVARSNGDLELSANLSGGNVVRFLIPYEESVNMPGDINNMPAQLLIRWLV